MYADTLRFYTRDRLARALALTNGRFSPTKCKSAISSVQWLHCKSIACTLSDHCCVYCPVCRGPGLESAADRGLSDGCRRCSASLHTLHLSYCKEMKFFQCFFYFKTCLHVQYMYVKS